MTLINSNKLELVGKYFKTKDLEQVKFPKGRAGAHWLSKLVFDRINMPLDRVFHSKDLKVSNWDGAGIVYADKTGSDHKPLIVKFKYMERNN